MDCAWRLLTEQGAREVWFGSGQVLENVRLARDIFRLRVVCTPIAQSILPGQFVMVRLPGYHDPLLGRAFALYDVFSDEVSGQRGIDLVYLAVGKMTRLLAQWRPGMNLELWGPLGNGFPPVNRPVLLMVAGGIGYTPFMAVAREASKLHVYGRFSRQSAAVKSIGLLLGVRSAEYLPSDNEVFRGLGVDVHVISDDGSTGRQGLATDLLEEQLGTLVPSEVTVFCCGPEAMMAKVAQICLEKDIPCYLSLETPMACGLGLCYSCVVRVKDGSQPEGWDYHRACVEGPVFEARQLHFDAVFTD